jgi:endonuclease YncB( thermonuclease family)
VRARRPARRPPRHSARGFYGRIGLLTASLLAAHALLFGCLLSTDHAGRWWASPAMPALPSFARASAAPASCGWVEPPRTYPDGVRWACTATEWADGDTLRARCDGQAGTVAVRLRGVDTDERDEVRWEQARDELRRRTAGHALTVLPRHHSHRRVVADVLAGGVNVGAAMDAAGWSKRDCPKR